MAVCIMSTHFSRAQGTFLSSVLSAYYRLIKYQYRTSSVLGLLANINSMGDGPRGIEVFEDHFQASTSGEDSVRSPSLSKYIGSNDSLRSISRSWTRRKLKGAASMLNLLSLSKLTWMSGADGQEKVVLTAAEVESLRSELVALEEREAHLKAQLQHIDEVVRAARLSGYLDMRMRWATLPGEPLPVDDSDVDDWLPRFFVLQGSCIFWYSSSTDLSPQDSTLLSDIIEVGTLPCLIRDNEDKRYCFYISTRYGLKYECSSISKMKVDSWLAALQSDCNLKI